VLGGDKRLLGLMEGLAESGASFLKLLSGGWSDRAVRRRGFVLVGYTIAVIARPIIGLLTAPWQLLVVRTADRAGKGIRTAPRDALIADSTPPEMRGRAFGFHRAMDHLGAAIGPLLALLFLWLWPGEYRTLFLVTLFPGLLVLALLWFGLREPPAAVPAPTREPLQLTLKPFGRDFRLYLVALVLFSLGNSSDMFLLIRAGELGVPPLLLPLLWFGFHVLKSGGNLLVGRAVDRYGPRRFLLLGWLLYAAVYFAFAAATDAWHAWVLFMAYAAFYSLTESSEKAFVVVLAGTEKKGLAFGWFNFALGITTLPASLLFGDLYERWGAVVAFVFGSALALLATLVLLAVRSIPPPSEEPSR
jgi:MFS family permease